MPPSSRYLWQSFFADLWSFTIPSLLLSLTVFAPEVIVAAGHLSTTNSLSLLASFFKCNVIVYTNAVLIYCWCGCACVVYFACSLSSGLN